MPQQPAGPEQHPVVQRQINYTHQRLNSSLICLRQRTDVSLEELGLISTTTKAGR